MITLNPPETLIVIKPGDLVTFKGGGGFCSNDPWEFKYYLNDNFYFSSPKYPGRSMGMMSEFFKTHLTSHNGTKFLTKKILSTEKVEDENNWSWSI